MSKINVSTLRDLTWSQLNNYKITKYFEKKNIPSQEILSNLSSLKKLGLLKPSYLSPEVIDSYFRVLKKDANIFPANFKEMFDNLNPKIKLTKHIALNDHPDAYKYYKKPYIRVLDAQGAPSLVSPPVEELQNKSVTFLLPSLDGDTLPGTSGYLKAMMAFAKHHIHSSDERFYPIALFPYASKETRFKAGNAYNDDITKQYVAPYIEELTEDILLPRFIDQKTSNLKAILPYTTFSGYSVGNREILQSVTCLVKNLRNKYKVSDEQIKYKVLPTLKAVHFGHAIEIEGIENNQDKISTTVIFNKFDTMVLRPTTILENMIFTDEGKKDLLFSTANYLIKDLINTLFGYDVFNISKEYNKAAIYDLRLSKDDAAEVLLIISKYIYDDFDDHNPHSLKNYLKGIEDLDQPLVDAISGELYSKIVHIDENQPQLLGDVDN